MRNAIFNMLLLLVTCVNPVSAQLSIGLNAGLAFADQRIQLPPVDLKTAGIYVPSAALLAEFSFKNSFSVRAAGGFVQKGTRVPESSTGPGGAYTRRLNEIEFSVSGVYTLTFHPVFLFVRGGPYWGYISKGTMKTDAGTRDIDFDLDDLKRQETGLTSGIGVGILVKRTRVFLESGYSAAFTSIADDSDSPVKYSIKNRGFSLVSAGVLVNLGHK